MEVLPFAQLNWASACCALQLQRPSYQRERERETERKAASSKHPFHCARVFCACMPWGVQIATGASQALHAAAIVPNLHHRVIEGRSSQDVPVSRPRAPPRPLPGRRWGKLPINSWYAMGTSGRGWTRSQKARIYRHFRPSQRSRATPRSAGRITCPPARLTLHTGGQTSDEDMDARAACLRLVRSSVTAGYRDQSKRQ